MQNLLKLYVHFGFYFYDNHNLFNIFTILSSIKWNQKWEVEDFTEHPLVVERYEGHWIIKKIVNSSIAEIYRLFGPIQNLTEKCINERIALFLLRVWDEYERQPQQLNKSSDLQPLLAEVKLDYLAKKEKLAQITKKYMRDMSELYLLVFDESVSNQVQVKLSRGLSLGSIKRIYFNWEVERKKRE